MIAPALFNRATAGASTWGKCERRRFDPLVVRKFTVSIVSLIVTGTPCKTPKRALCATARSASCARLIASGANVTTAFSFAFNLSVRRKKASMISTGETRRARTSRAISEPDKTANSSLKKNKILPDQGI